MQNEVYILKPKLMTRKIGIVDIDLLDNGTRHPNLVLMKIAGYLRDKSLPYELIFGDGVNMDKYHTIYASKVFTFSKEPSFLQNIEHNGNAEHEKMQGRQESQRSKKNRLTVIRGGTGYYADEEDTTLFNRLRNEDMVKLENDPRLPGFSLATQMPDYTLYNEYITREIAQGKKASSYKDYKDYSIGFLTRGCIRRCPFCVNKNIHYVYDYSRLSDFVDESRSKIYLWDDNFLAAKNWRVLLQSLQETNKPFQFRQGLDIRLITHEKAKMLAESRYHGDYMFAFDLIKDKTLIEKKLAIWRTHTSKTTKLYLFCGYEITDDHSLITDILNLFIRIEILMKYKCLGYVMRHQHYKNHPLNNIYVQIARWCNQPQFYKKLSFHEFIQRNQYWKKTDTKCKALRTYEEFINYFDDYRDELAYYFNIKYETSINTIQKKA